MLCNPERKMSAELLRGWAERVMREPDYGKVRQADGEGCLVSKDGLLQIPWPRLAQGEKNLDVDFLLATANDPTIEGTPPAYPSVEKIAAAWNRAAEKHAEYFWKNVGYGICTFQDDAIRALLRPRGSGAA